MPSAESRALRSGFKYIYLSDRSGCFLLPCFLSRYVLFVSLSYKRDNCKLKRETYYYGQVVTRNNGLGELG